jgi:hypothetical protein
MQYSQYTTQRWRLLKWSFFLEKDQTYTANEVGAFFEVLVLSEVQDFT